VCPHSFSDGEGPHFPRKEMGIGELRTPRAPTHPENALFESRFRRPVQTNDDPVFLGTPQKPIGIARIEKEAALRVVEKHRVEDLTMALPHVSHARKPRLEHFLATLERQAHLFDPAALRKGRAVRLARYTFVYSYSQPRSTDSSL
jgi:hypothetical protein